MTTHPATTSPSTTPANVNLTGDGALKATGNGTFTATGDGTFTVTGDGTFTATGNATLTVTGDGTFTATGNGKVQGSGTGTFTATSACDRDISIWWFAVPIALGAGVAAAATADDLPQWLDWLGACFDVLFWFGVAALFVTTFVKMSEFATRTPSDYSRWLKWLEWSLNKAVHGYERAQKIVQSIGSWSKRTVPKFVVAALGFTFGQGLASQMIAWSAESAR